MSKGGYSDAIPLDKPFAWDSARGQLELFASLGVKAELDSAFLDKIHQAIIRNAAA
jgi:hypothetical protein